MRNWNLFSKTSDDKVDEKTKTDASQDALLDRFAALIEEKNKPINEAITNLKSKWDAIEQEVAKSGETSNRNTNEKTPEERDREEKNALLQLNVATNARITESDCINSISAQWSNLIPQIRDIFLRTPITRKAQPDYAEYCMNVVDMTVGKAARAAGLRSDGTKFYIEDSASRTGGEDSPLGEIPIWQGDDRVETATETLSKLGIDPKKFAEDFKAGRLN